MAVRVADLVAVRVTAKIISINALSTLNSTIAKTPNSMVRSCLFNVANLVMQVQVVQVQVEAQEVNHAKMSTATVPKSCQWLDVTTRSTPSPLLEMFAANSADEKKDPIQV